MAAIVNIGPACGRLALSVAIGALAIGALSASLVQPAVAGSPQQLVTLPNGSVAYVTPLGGAGFVIGPNGASYVNANGSPSLITNPNGSVSYANVNGGPSLVTGPDGSLSYQNVIAGTTGWGNATLAYVNQFATNPSASGSAPAGLSIPLTQLTSSGPIPRHAPAVSGRYCNLPDGSGQVWIDYGAPTGDADCGGSSQ